MSNLLIVGPTEEPLTLAEAKLACRVDHDDEDALISMLISAARGQCEFLLQRSIMRQTRRVTLDCFPSEIKLDYPDVLSVDSVKYVSAETGQFVPLDSSLYVLDVGRPHQAWLLPAVGANWPATAAVANALVVDYVCGYDSADKVPDGIKLWIGMAVATFYKHREFLVTGTIVSKLPETFFSSLIGQYKVWRL